MAGCAEDRPENLTTFIDNLRHAAAQAGKRQLVIEPINQDDMPGYFLSDFDLALAVLEAVNAPNLGLQFDAYHTHRITGDVAGAWEKVRHKVVPCAGRRCTGAARTHRGRHRLPRLFRPA